MIKIIIIVSAIALLFLVTTYIFGRMYFKQKREIKQENQKTVSIEKQTKNLKERILENEKFQKDNNTASFNASVDILHDIANR